MVFRGHDKIIKLHGHGQDLTDNASGNTYDTIVRWYNVCGTMQLGYWKSYQLRQVVTCSNWHSIMDDGGYALSTDPNQVHSPDGSNGLPNGTDASWNQGPDHIGNKDASGNYNGLMLCVNAALEPGIFYERSVQGLCYGTTFQFSAWYADLNTPDACGTKNGVNNSVIPINIRYEIWNRNPGQNEANSTVAVGGIACNGASIACRNKYGERICRKSAEMVQYCT